MSDPVELRALQPHVRLRYAPYDGTDEGRTPADVISVDVSALGMVIDISKPGRFLISGHKLEMLVEALRLLRYCQ